MPEELISIRLSRVPITEAAPAMVYGLSINSLAEGFGKAHNKWHSKPVPTGSLLCAVRRVLPIGGIAPFGKDVSENEDMIGCRESYSGRPNR